MNTENVPVKNETSISNVQIEPYLNFCDAQKSTLELTKDEMIYRGSLTPEARFKISLTEATANFIKHVSSDEKRVKRFVEGFINGYNLSQDFLKENPDFLKLLLEEETK